MTQHDDDLDPAGVLVGQTYDQSWPADPPPDGYRWVSVQRDDSHPVYDGDMAAAVAYATHIGSPVPPRWGRPDDPDQDPSDLTGCDVFVAVPGPPPAATGPSLSDLPRETGPGRPQLETTGLVDPGAADLWRRHGLSDRWAAAARLGDGLYAYPLAAASFPTYEPDQADGSDDVRQWPNPATRTFTEQQVNAVTQPPPRWRGEAVLVAMLAVAGVGLALVFAGLLILTQGSAGLPLVVIAAAGAAGGGAAGAVVVASRRRVDRLWRDLP